MLNGVRLGIDVGKVRIGVAKSDPAGILATPYATVQRDREGTEHINQIADIAKEVNAKVIYVGNPLSLSGNETESTRDALAVAAELTDAGFEVRLVDERLTTVTAQANLHASGKNVKKSRAVIDQSAATVLLQHALDIEKRNNGG